MKIYIASKVQPHAPHWRCLRAVLAELGVDVACSWLDAELNEPGAEPDSEAWRTHWARCIDEASAADVTIFYAEHARTQCGALLEVGAALSAGRQVFMVSDYDWSIAHHPNCRTFGTLEQAVAALVAAAHGERQRDAA